MPPETNKFDICFNFHLPNDFLSYRLSIFDCFLIVDSIVQKSIVPYFSNDSGDEPAWFKITFVYLWYPFKGIILTATIYMMVAISAERFRAVCYPLSNRHVSVHLNNLPPLKILQIIFSCCINSKYHCINIL